MAGWLLGLFVGAGAVLATAGVVKRTLGRSAPPLAGVFWILTIQGAKLPLFVFVIFFTKSMGYTPAWTFLGGYFLVYLALTVGAIGEAYAPSRTE
jgi:drug/metabolite transporter (DMT)-like permease